MATNEVITKYIINFFYLFRKSNLRLLKNSSRGFLQIIIILLPDFSLLRPFCPLGLYKGLIFLVFCLGVFKVWNLVNFATWKLDYSSQCSQMISRRPIRYSESWINSVRKILLQICSVMSFSGVKVSLNFFSKRGDKTMTFISPWDLSSRPPFLWFC